MIPIYEKIVDPDNPSYPGDMLQLGALYLKRGDAGKGPQVPGKFAGGGRVPGPGPPDAGPPGRAARALGRGPGTLCEVCRAGTVRRCARHSTGWRKPRSRPAARRWRWIFWSRRLPGEIPAPGPPSKLGWMYYNTSRLDESYSMLHRLEQARGDQRERPLRAGPGADAAGGLQGRVRIFCGRDRKSAGVFPLVSGAQQRTDATQGTGAGRRGP